MHRSPESLQIPGGTANSHPPSNRWVSGYQVGSDPPCSITSWKAENSPPRENRRLSAETLVANRDQQAGLEIDRPALSGDAEGGSAVYSMIRGTVGSLREDADLIHLGSVSCVAGTPSDVLRTLREDSLSPPRGQAFFYLVDYDVGGHAGFGSPWASKPRVIDSTDCPASSATGK